MDLNLRNANDLEIPREKAENIDILHIPYTYFPDKSGGTEVYVSSLASSLQKFGLVSAIAAPNRIAAEYEYEGVPVFRFGISPQPSFEQAHGIPDKVAAFSFREICSRLRPRILHLHARSAAVSELLVQIAHEAGARVVLTYHTPTVSCARGTMMLMGKTPCDGTLDVRRCTDCVLDANGVSHGLRALLTMLPAGIGVALERAGVAGGIFTALRMKALTRTNQHHFKSLMENTDCIVAVCDWVRNVLRANGVPDSKLLLCRQGLAQYENTGMTKVRLHGREKLRLGFFGRLDRTKGVDIVIEALRLVPGANVEFDIFGIRQLGSEAYASQIERAAANDSRIGLRTTLRSSEVAKAMCDYDVIVVPSRWLETGPLVALEAFGAGRPVLGSNLGGIAELVTDGVDGVLVDPDDPAAWSAAIESLASDPSSVSRLAGNIRPPRTMDDVARDMASIYGSVLSDADV